MPDAAGLGALDVTRAARPSTPAVQGPVHEGPLPPLPSPPGVAAVVLRPLQLATPVGAPLPVVAPPAAGLGLAAPASVVLVSESDLSSDPLGDLPLSPATGAPKGPAPRAAVPTVPDGPAFDATDVPSNTVPVEALIPAAERQPARAAWAPYEEDDSPTQMQPVEEVVQGGREDTEVDVVPAAQVEDDDDLVIDGPPLTAPTAPHAVPAAPSLSPPAPPTPAAPAARPAAKGGAGAKIAALAALGCFGLLALGAVASGGLYLWSGRSAAPSAAVADAPAGGGAAALAADEPEDGEAPAPDAAAGDPAPSAAMARFSVAADAPFAAEVKSVDVSCDNKAQSKGEAAAEVDPGGATTCTVKVMLKDRSRKVVKVSGPAAGDWSCFPAGEPRCTQ